MRAFSMFTVGDDGKLIISSNAGEVSGPELLLEKIAKFLLTVPGSNIADPNYGSLLGDKAYMARMGGDENSVRILVINAVEGANSYFKGHEYLDHLELIDVLVDENDPTVYYAEIFVYLTDGSIYNITV